MNICSSIRVPTMLALTAIVSVLLFSPISYNSAWAQSADVVEPSAPEVDPEAVPDAEEIRGLILAAVPNSISDGGTVSLLAGVSNGTNIQWTWNFGDGSGLTDSGTDKSNLQEHTFNLSNPSVSQTFVVSVNASNENNPRGVTATATVNVRVKAPANLSVTYAPDPPAAQQPIQFVAQVESKANVTYKWEFGDGTVIMGGPVVSHVYATQGIFKVKVTATNAGGAVTHEKRIAIDDSPLTFCQILVEGASTVNNPLTFTALNDGTNVSYNWSLGDGASNANQSFTHAYSAPGEYIVRLTCSNNNNSIDTERKLIILNRAPNSVTILSDEPFDSPLPVNRPVFFGVFAGGGTNVTYTWDFGDGRTHVTQNASVNHKYTKTGVYAVRVLAKNDQGEGSSFRMLYVVGENPPEIDRNNGLELTYRQAPAQFYPFITVNIPVRLLVEHGQETDEASWWQEIEADDIKVEWKTAGTIIPSATASSSMQAIPEPGERQRIVIYDAPGRYVERAIVRVRISENPETWVVAAVVETIVSVGGRISVPILVR